jgi:ABC-type multidrug transport system fused ATPase/permease subunit
MSFFETQPLGRLLNRFSKDTETVDSAIPEPMHHLITCLSELPL